jgi:benzylsuccinate CoA-transferase BbsF subunit
MQDTLPFEGIKIADFSWVGVGPISTKYLADHGATVVRVETTNPLDILRVAGPFKDGVPGPDRSQFFADYNTSKYGITLDLKNPAAIEVAHRLIAWADVLVESFTPGTADSLGIGYETARSINPSIIMASTCLMGQTGPASSFAGFGFHAGSIAGYYEITGWPDLPPDGPWTAYTDTVSPRFLAAILMAALDHQRRTGEGQHIDAAQLEMSLHFLGPQLVDYSVSGRSVTRNGNRSPYMAPHGVFPCQGEDQWCAIAVETDQQWTGLQAAMGSPDWAKDLKFDKVEDRLANQEEIEIKLSEWTQVRPPKAVMEALHAEGVPAGVVQRSSDLQRDPQLAHRRFFRDLEHQEMGTIPYPGHQFRISGYDSGPRSAAPVLGQHNDEVLRDVLGMTDEEITEAIIAGALSG